MRVDYDSIASTYHQRYANGPLPGVAACLHRLATRINAARLLEVGCGTGQWLSELNSDGQLFGLDFSAGMLRQARQNAPAAHLSHGNAPRLPFPEAAFDLVFCVNAFHHFDSKPVFIREARRVLRPGGALSVMGLDPRLSADGWYLYQYFEGTLATDLDRFSSSGQMLDWMVQSGFGRVEWEATQVVLKTYTGREVMSDPFLPKNSTSQLVLLSEAVYAEGLRKLEADVARAEDSGEAILFPANITFTMITGYVDSPPHI